MFAQLGGTGALSPVDMLASKADLIDCTFAGNFIGGDNEGVVQSIYSSVALENATFTANFGPGNLLHAIDFFDRYPAGGGDPMYEGVEAQFFSDDDLALEYCDYGDGAAPVQALALADTNRGDMLEWLSQKRQVRF